MTSAGRRRSREALRRAVLREALPAVPFDGWSSKLLRAAAGDEGAAARAFPGGPRELIDFYLAEGDRGMEAALAGVDLPGMKIRQRIATAVRLRLQQMAGEREAVRRLLAVQALPGNQARALRQLYRTVDAIWRGVGDTSTDFSFYTKRALLAGVYGTTLLYWLNDDSPGFENTWAFLDRRIADVMRIQKARRPLDRLAERLPSPWPLVSRLRYPRRAAS